MRTLNIPMKNTQRRIAHYATPLKRVSYYAYALTLHSLANICATNISMMLQSMLFKKNVGIEKSVLRRINCVAFSSWVD